MNTADDTTVTVDGDTVVKIHRAGTDPQELAARLRIASASGCLLTPLSAEPEAVSTIGGERWRTRWPLRRTKRWQKSSRNRKSAEFPDSRTRFPPNPHNMQETQP